MHFRFRGNNVQVVKSQLDPKTGKAKSVPLGSINLRKLAISEKLAANCSPDELKDIEAWVKRRQALEVLKGKLAALTLPEQIGAAIGWLRNAPAEEVEEIADDVLTALKWLRHVLHRRGLA